ncbi:MAG: hypothetical protein LHV69_03470 [Elusimicrobia bacterium]|nr:hypothetical protein [Candidatus Obscuribacterium magneticum]
MKGVKSRHATFLENVACRDLTPFTFILLILCGAFSFAGAQQQKPFFPIKDAGTEFPVKYENYGSFVGRGTKDYKYKLKDKEGLARAVGAGLFPNDTSVLKEPGFKKWRKAHKEGLSPWEFVNTGNPQSDFYAWTQAKEVGPGTKLFFTAEALAEGGHPRQALKAYYAALVHFPGEPCWSEDLSFVWYIGPTALSKIEVISKNHPEVGIRLKGASCEVKNGNDTDLKNDVVIVEPGHWVVRGGEKAVSLEGLPIIGERGYGRVRLVQFQNKHWQLRVDGKPYVVRGMTYNPTPVGQHVSGKGLNSWMSTDSDENGKADAPYDAWVDANKNGVQDPNELSVGDFELLKEMGVNTLRVFRSSQESEYDPSEFNKETLRDLYQNYGISCIMGDFLGAYTVGSGASWADGTDYTDPVQLERMRSIVKDYVTDFRGEPFVLMWLLGNENLMASDYNATNATRTQAARQVDAYLRFVNEIAEMIHQLDPDHPVAVGNLDLVYLAEHASYAPAVDVFGANSYRSLGGFGDLWKVVRERYDRPVLITEYGMDAYNAQKMMEEENTQARYHELAWKDIELNLADGPEEGNAIGGIIFEYLDEWWKSLQGPITTHEGVKDQTMAFPDRWGSDEWYGLMSQGDGLESPFLRQPRKAYTLYRDKLWKRHPDESRDPE